jgi:hypothetical protein
MSERAAAAIQLAVETTSQAIAVEQENEELRKQLKKNEALIESFTAAAPRARALQTQLREKQAEIEQKQKDLIALQSAIIDTLKNPPQPPSQSQEGSLEVIPIVMNSVLKQITTLTEKAIDEKSIGIPILSLFKAAEGLNHLYGTLCDKKIITESPEEKQERIEKYVSTQREILTKLREIVNHAQSEPAEEAPATVTEEAEPQ